MKFNCKVCGTENDTDSPHVFMEPTGEYVGDCDWCGDPFVVEEK